jgi:hypothetical protein
MNTSSLVVILVMAWVIYALMNSNQNIENELRQIRTQCVLSPMPATNSSISKTASNMPSSNYSKSSIKNLLINQLTKLY